MNKIIQHYPELYLRYFNYLTLNLCPEKHLLKFRSELVENSLYAQRNLMTPSPVYLNISWFDWKKKLFYFILRNEGAYLAAINIRWNNNRR